MIAKCLALVASALCCVSATEAPPMPQFVAYPQIQQVHCTEGMGTAFRAKGRWLSVNHVTMLHNCHIGTKAIAAKQEGNLDFSIAGPALGGFEIDCAGFQEGEPYYAVGYANGFPVQRLVVLKGTGAFDDNGMAVLFGIQTLIPGMSGGPILSKEGKVVGLNNMFHRWLPLSLSVELKQTSLCR